MQYQISLNFFCVAVGMCVHAVCVRACVRGCVHPTLLRLLITCKTKPDYLVKQVLLLCVCVYVCVCVRACVGVCGWVGVCVCNTLKYVFQST